MRSQWSHDTRSQWSHDMRSQWSHDTRSRWSHYLSCIINERKNVRQNMCNPHLMIKLRHTALFWQSKSVGNTLRSIVFCSQQFHTYICIINFEKFSYLFWLLTAVSPKMRLKSFLTKWFCPKRHFCQNVTYELWQTKSVFKHMYNVKIPITLQLPSCQDCQGSCI